jgi:ABC-2 type transport system permease protein
MSSTLRVALAVGWRMLHNNFTNPSLLIPGLAFPLFFFTAFAGGLSRVNDIPGFQFPVGYTAFQFVFVLLQSAAFAGVFTGFGIVRDFETGFARRLMLAAPDRRGILLGYALGALGRWSFTATVLTVVALVAGMEVGGSGVDLFALYTLAVLVNFCGLLWSAGVAMRLRTLQAAPLMQLPIFLSLFFAPVFVPVEFLAGWLEAIARLNPVTLLLEAGRSLIAGQPDDVAVAFVAVFALVAAFAVWGVRGLRRAEAAGGGG